MGRNRVAVGLLVLGLSATPLLAQAPAPAVPPASPVSDDYVFKSATGLLIFHVRPDAVADFETIVGRLAHGLETSTDPVRRQQKEGWRLFRSSDAPPSEAIFVMVIDPVVAGSDYDPVRMLTEFVPAESPTLYQRLKAAVIRIERMGLTRVR